MRQALPALLSLCGLALGLASGPALAQGGSCVTNQVLRVDAAFSRHGAGGTFDYSVQVSNMTGRPVTFRVNFRMTRAQVHPQILSQAFTLPVAGSRIIVLGNGPEQSTPTRIGGGVVLTC